jgi:formylmethanofuran dehydrogenase subunit E
MSQVWCSKCHKAILASAPRVILDGDYVCQVCIYHLDRGETPPKR